MKIIDISPPINENTAVWPGDAPYERKKTMEITSSCPVETGKISSTLHLGAHVDAPNHFKKGAAGVDELELGAYIGTCQVVEVKLPRGERIFPEHLASVEVRAPRILLKTGSFPDPQVFNQDFNSFSPELICFLADHGCLLIGIDTPSVDPFEAKTLHAHLTLLEKGIRNLEGIVLTSVKPGMYYLSALPLRLTGADASPVRAVLLSH